MAATISDIVESSQAERLATGFVFTEGPLWHPDGYLLFVDIRRSQIFKLVPGGEPEIIRENSGESNGMTFDSQGRVVICEMVNRRVTRMEAGGRPHLGQDGGLRPAGRARRQRHPQRTERHRTLDSKNQIGRASWRERV